jgi:NADP-dependent 3-hydroxy acid dehydrogenase YdfG
MARSFRHAVVTGASSGIGRAVAIRLATGGTNVVGIGRDTDRLAGLAQDAAPGRIRPLVLDLADDAAVDRAGQDLSGELPELDLLVHAAGVYARAPMTTGPVAELDRVMAVNLRAPYLVTQLLLPSLIRAGGQVAFVNSTIVQRPAADEVAYAASKAALRALADGLRQEIGGSGVRVLSVYAGRTDTPMQETVHRLEGRPPGADRLLAPADVAEALVSALAAPPAAQVTDLVVRPVQPSSPSGS